MKAELKRKWLEALRSGAYKQCRNVLKENSESGDSYCCLGVLGEIAGLPVDGDTEGGVETLYNPINALFHDACGGPGPTRSCTAGDAAGMNDEGRSFAEIADWIEKNEPATDL